MVYEKREKEDNCDTFSLEQNVPIYIYSAGYRGKEVSAKMKSSGYNIKGIIDENAENMLPLDDIKIFTLEQFSHFYEKECIVIICLQNGLIHEQVADKLSKIGVRKLIFIPMLCKATNFQKSKWRETYGYIMRQEYYLVKNVPEFNIRENETDICIIRKETNGVIFWCPIEYLHTSSVEMIERRVAQRLANSKPILYQYANIPVEQAVPYNELFSYLTGNSEANIDYYLTAMGRVEDEEKNLLLEDRKKLFMVYEQSHRIDMNFFYDSPSKACWNKSGYFNVEDGMHRIHYLIEKGHREVPIWVSIEEFNLFNDYLRGVNKNDR